MPVTIRYVWHLGRALRRKYSMGYVAFSDRRTKKVWVDLSKHGAWYRRNHRSAGQLVEEMMRSIDHEIAHVFSDRDDNSCPEERFVQRFEAAGSWARRA